MEQRAHPRPAWLKARFPSGERYFELKALMRGLDLHTVCEEARCPNIGECWDRRSATIMLLGDTCTRACGFCAVKTGLPGAVDAGEPARVAQAVEKLGLRYVVLTSVDRDDLPDGGAWVFAESIRQIRHRLPSCEIEVLTPDFKKSMVASLETVLDARPDVFNHNVETTPRLYRTVRPGASFEGSLELLRGATKRRPDLRTKSGFMVGLGESMAEACEVLERLRDARVSIATIGQYLQPTKDHLPVSRFVAPEEFRELKEHGERLGIPHVESGPLVRSSYHADEQSHVPALSAR
ncbi:MAG: lipoyl synthase [Acidobacteriota bacterium]